MALTLFLCFFLKKCDSFMHDLKLTCRLMVFCLNCFILCLFSWQASAVWVLNKKPSRNALCQTNSWSYCDLILLLRQNKSDDRFSKNSSFNILDSYFRMCLQLLMHKKTRFTNYSKWCCNISWRRQFMIWHHFEFLLTGLLILEILFILWLSIFCVQTNHLLNMNL